MPLTDDEKAALEISRATHDENDASIGIEDDVSHDDGGGDAGHDDGGSEPQQRQAKRELPPMSPFDEKRNSIIDRFRRPDTRPFDGDMTRPENIYGEVADEHLDPGADGADADVLGSSQQEQQQDQRPAPKKYQLKIRGKVVEMSEDEVLERAQKVEAADTYLEESRQLLQEAKTIRAERDGQRTQHPEHQTNTQDDVQGFDPQDSESRTHGQDLKAVVEKIQYGDPAEAANELAEVIERRASEVAQKAADEGHIKRLMDNDLARSRADLQAFREANSDLVRDEIAAQVIEQQIYKIYREEIQALGMVEESKIPTDPQTLANWHRFYRVNGHQVSKTSDVLNKAKDRYSSWRGDTPQNSKPAAPRKEAPRVAVNVDRSERRQAIPQQPTRAVAPRRDPAPAQTVEQSRKSAVAEMRKARGQTLTS